ncbi:hypothetical protein JMUB7542_27880 [Staphylococcus aureus]
MKHQIGYDLHTPNVDVSEENPDELFDAVLMTIKYLSLIHISEPTRLALISYAVFCLKKTMT